jgi:hypothetical protein
MVVKSNSVIYLQGSGHSHWVDLANCRVPADHLTRRGLGEKRNHNSIQLKIQSLSHRKHTASPLQTPTDEGCLGK